MRGAERNINQKRIANNRLGMLAIIFVSLVLLCWLLMQSRGLSNRLAYYDARISSLQQSIVDEEVRTGEIEELKEYMLTDEFAEEVARERLGLVKENEIVFREEQ